MDRLIDLIKVITALAWPAIVAVVFWKFYPDLKNIVASRAFTIKIAGMELSAQDATEQIRSQINDLQQQVIALKAGHDEVAVPTAFVSIPEAHEAKSKNILWVDDKPQNNALEIAQLQDRGFDVVQSTSTEDALKIMNINPGYTAVISDMGRREAGTYRSQAGIMLLNAMRRAGHRAPFMIYSSAQYASRNRDEVRKAGGDGATASAVELLAWVERVAATPV